jgi:glycosyltransferase involved in cell wall biosynthesis
LHFHFYSLLLLPAFLVSLVALTVLIQLGYLLYHILKLDPHRDPQPYGNPEPLSLIVAARNEHRNLIELLPLLLEQRHPALEIVIIDDRSEDDTHFYLSGLQQYYPQVKVVTVKFTPQNTSPKKYALTLGIRAATHERLLFTDADCRPLSLDWAARMSAGFNEGEIILGFSPYRAAPGLLNKLIRFETLVTAWQYLGAALHGHAYMGVGRNLAYSKGSFLRNKGFASHIRQLSGDDDLFVNEAARHSWVAVCIDKEAQTESAPKETWTEWWAQKTRHLSAGKHYRLADKIRLGLYSVSSISFYILLAISIVYRVEVAWWGSLLATRTLALAGLNHLAARKLIMKLPVLWVPLLDLLYHCTYLALGIKVLLTRTVKWK